MSLYDYNCSKKLEALDPPLDALIMAAMRKAGGPKLERLRLGFPRVYEELQERYGAPQGLLEGETTPNGRFKREDNKIIDVKKGGKVIRTL